MNSLILYILQVTAVFSVLYLCYLLTLRKLTFYALNRAILLGMIPISFLLPLINDAVPSFTNSLIEIPVFDEVYQYVPQDIAVIEPSPTTPSVNYMLIIGFLYGLGLLACLLRVYISIRKLVVLKRTSIKQQKTGYELVVGNVSQVFSFFNTIYLPKNSCDPLIIAHEKAHIHFRHSVDLIFLELFIAIFWFNPLSYLFRKSLKAIHEYQADEKVIHQQGKPSEYLELLLRTIDISNPNHTYNYFKHPILKQRIDMITKTKSSPFTKLKYVFLVLVCVFLVSAFSKPIVNEVPITKTMVIELSDDIPPSLFPVQNGTEKDITSHYGHKRNNLKIGEGIIHRGIDIRGSVGTPVLATADGVVAKASLEGNWGNLIVIQHADGYETWYAHLDGFNTEEKQTVKKGDVIGYLGNTGKSTGPHLHYEVRHEGKYLDPIDYLK